MDPAMHACTYRLSERGPYWRTFRGADSCAAGGEGSTLPREAARARRYARAPSAWLHFCKA
jgi:hypothetical protein